MKTNIYISILVVLVATACKTNVVTPANSTANLKAIIYSNDTVTPLCLGCPSVVTQKREYFNYDNANRLITRILTSTTLSPTPTKTDTIEAYNYVYNAQSLITSYTQLINTGVYNHLLNYDSQGRLVLDSITNPTASFDNVFRIEYIPTGMVQTCTFSMSNPTNIIKDSIFISGNYVSRIFSKVLYANGSSSYNEANYQLSNYKHPLSYVNNWSLLNTDHKIGVSAITFLMFNPQDMTAYVPVQIMVKSGTNNTAPTFSTLSYTPVIDSIGRVKNIIYGRNKSNTYLYN